MIALTAVGVIGRPSPLQAGPFRDAWTLEAIHRRPTIALVCQHGRMLDALPSTVAYDHRHRARFGAMLSVRPLTADDPVHPSRLVAVLDESFPARQRVLAHQRARHARAMQLPLWGPTAPTPWACSPLPVSLSLSLLPWTLVTRRRACAWV